MGTCSTEHLRARSIPKGSLRTDRKSTRLNSSHPSISYAVFCLKKKMAQVMLREEEALLPVHIRGEGLQLLVQKPLLEQLLSQPERQRHAEGGIAPGREGEIGLQQPLELEEGLVVEGDVVDLLRLQPVFFFNDTATTEIYTLSLHDALPI